MGLSEEGSPTEIRPEGLERAERDLRRAIQVGIDENNELSDRPETMSWQTEFEAVMQALDEGDVETLRRYAQGWIAPGFPYRGSVELYVNIFDIHTPSS